MHALPAALFLLIPVFSLVILYARIARSKTLLSRAHAAPIFVFVSLGALAIVAAILGLTESITRVELLIALIQFELGASTVYVFGAYIPSKVISWAKVHVCNALIVILLLGATVTGIIAPLGGVPPIVPAALALASAIAPLPLLAKMVPVRGGARFWLLLCGAQVAGCIAGVLGVLQADSKFWTLETQLEIAHTAFVVLWAVGIMTVFVFLPESTVDCGSHSERSALSPKPSKSPCPSPSLGSDPSDFLNLRDPFASPPPARPSLPLASLSPLCPLEKPSSPFGYFGPGAIFRPRKSKRSKAKAPAAEDVNEEKGQDGPGQDEPRRDEPRQDEPTCFPAPGELDAYEISIDAEEALLSQLLLRNLSVTEPPPTPPLPNASAMYFPALRDPLGLGRGAVVVTCERRGSSSTLTNGNVGHRLGRARFGSEGSTLVDFEERRVKDLPPPPSPAPVSVHELEKDLDLVNEADEMDDEDYGEEDRRATPTPPGLGGRDTPPAYFYSQPIDDEYDAQSTPRALSPSS